MDILNNQYYFGCIVTSSSFYKGIKRGIDFTGGTEVVIAYRGFTATENGKIDLDFIKENLEKNNFEIKNISLLKIDEKGANYVLIRLPGDIKEEDRVNFENAWSFNHDPHYEATQISENIIGPSIGKELTKKAIWSIVLVSIVIILFVAFSFRSFKAGIKLEIWIFNNSLLLHDITIPLGMYVILGITHGAEIDSLFCACLAYYNGDLYGRHNSSI